MNHKWSTIFLSSTLLFNSTTAVAGLLLSPYLSSYSALSGAALNIAADSVVSSDLAARAAVAIGANTDTANIYAGAAANLGAGATATNIYAGNAAGIGANASTENIYAGAAVVLGARASATDIYSGAAIGLGAGATVGDIYAAAAITGNGANSSTPFANTAPEISSYAQNLNIDNAMQQITDAQSSLFNLDSDYSLATTLADYTFTPGVYEGSALTVAAGSTITLDGLDEENPVWIFNLSEAMTVGANNIFEITNAGVGASVIWNIGDALSLGAQTSFIGTVFTGGAVSGGAGSSISCGNIYATAAIGIGSVTSTNCIATETWAGSIDGFASNIDITDGIVSNSSFSVPEPATGLMMFSFVLLLLAPKLKRK
ncbi:MAG: hypothetical protein ACJAZP_000161 [Psychromonas sp.]|jgi:hypothetical protein|uniref:ice-binding family protein n=1 Tax=Psychromonas sp. TaxID=1884585 RepID=UPI0039E6ECB6